VSYKGGVSKQTDSPSITDKDFSAHIPSVFILKYSFWVNAMVRQVFDCRA
jgi:hypothetical protein